jgi:hypothetical protein
MSTIDFCSSISAIRHHFDNFYILPNMDQQPSKLINNQPISPLILTIPKELLTMIASFMNTKSQLALAHTCKTMYCYHKEKCKEEIITFLCCPPIDINFECYYKVLKHWLSEPGWAAVKPIFKRISTDSQSNDSCLIRALYLYNSLQFPSKLKCENINALMLNFFPRVSSTSLSISFLEKFPNLKMLWLSNVIINENIVSALSTLSLLNIITLDQCEITDDYLSKIFESCTTLEEIELHYIFFKMPIMFPPQVKRLRMEGHYPMQIDLSRCTQLRSL